jgi:hypothetical protein
VSRVLLHVRPKKKDILTVNVLETFFDGDWDRMDVCEVAESGFDGFVETDGCCPTCYRWETVRGRGVRRGQTIRCLGMSMWRGTWTGCSGDTEVVGT